MSDSLSCHERPICLFSYNVFVILFIALLSFTKLFNVYTHIFGENINSYTTIGHIRLCFKIVCFVKFYD